MVQTVKNLAPVQETQAKSLGWEDPLDKGMHIHSSILAMDRGAWDYSQWSHKELDMTNELIP